MTEDSKSVATIRCADADELIRSLRAKTREPVQRGPRPYAWAYRGQADSRWKLTPAALRPGVTLGYYPDRRQHESKGYGGDLDQVNGELVAVRQFAELADRVGLPVPGFHPIFRQDAFDFGCYNSVAIGGKLGVAEWPTADMLELLAIAQHHGVPTRLLDFTYDLLFALFFAANDIVASKSNHQKNGVTELAVWGVNIHKLYGASRDFTVVEVQRAPNPFLRAQKGLFVLDRRICDDRSGEVTRSLDERIATVFRPDASTPPAIVKFTMPVDEADHALESLAVEGIDRAHLMPSYDNVVSFLRMVATPSRQGSGS